MTFVLYVVLLLLCICREDGSSQAFGGSGEAEGGEPLRTITCQKKEGGITPIRGAAIRPVGLGLGRS